MTGYVNVRDHIAEKVGNDWAPAFAAAIAAAKGTSRGVFGPAAAMDYTVRKPGPKLPSIDLRGLTDFTLLGEGDGSRIRLIGSGGGGAWKMITIGGDSTDVTVQGLCLDGDADDLTDSTKINRRTPFGLAARSAADSRIGAASWTAP
jgi:hypothetical protein